MTQGITLWGLDTFSLYIVPSGQGSRKRVIDVDDTNKK